MPADITASRVHEEMPESQRETQRSPQTFPRISRVVPRSPGAYRMIHGQPQEEPQSCR